MSAANVLSGAAVVSETAPEIKDTQPVEGTEEKKDPILSPQLGVLAKKERELVRRQQEMKRREDEWSKEREQILQRLKEKEEREKLFSDDPLKALESFGHSYQSLTERQLAGGEITPKEVESKLTKRLQEFEEKLTQKEKQAQEEAAKKKQEEESATVQNYKQDLRGFIESKKGDYKLVSLFDKEADLVYETIEAYFSEHNKVLSHEEASTLVEKYFQKLVKQANETLTPPKEDETEEPQERFGFPQRTGDAPKTAKTITNSMQSSSVPSFLPAKNEEDRLRRALAALQ